jgi:polyphenol oxidase
VKVQTPLSWITPDWPAAPRVNAVSTFRHGGVSRGSCASLNLAAHVGDDPEAVQTNRHQLAEALGLKREPFWLTQIHGAHVVECSATLRNPSADASICFEPDAPCCVLTADCLPVLFCDRDATRVGVAHAGWKGLVKGVLEKTVTALNCPPASIIAWLGPAIGPQSFEVGEEVRARFVAKNPRNEACFKPSPNGRWLADIYGLARLALIEVGVSSVYGGGLCTYLETDRFFSYRRDPAAGRMATLVWLAA